VTKPIRVLVVDDSIFVRRAISRMLSKAGDIEVAGTATDGREALEKIRELKPDIVTLDVKMSGMDGLAALERIMAERPTPVLMVSSYTREGAEITLRALNLGAVDFIDKNRVESAMDISQLTGELLEKIRVISGVDMAKVRLGVIDRTKSEVPPPSPAAEAEGSPATSRPVPPARAPVPAPPRAAALDVVAIGTSTGGPPSLHTILPSLPADFPAGVVVVQHMPPGFTRSLAERLDAHCAMTVSEAVRGDMVLPGRILIAPAGLHLRLLRTAGGYQVLLDSRPVTPHRPSADIMMESVARACGARCLGVILTGMGEDGTVGMRAIRQAGGRTLAESEETSLVYGMPRAAVQAGVVDRIVPLYSMAEAILSEVSPN
jgi:two-component system chemotaxis response regulator CheB